ncbi:MAG: hypothetical protein HW416_429 [Chloroflexi bacterium]|nr:hypothetical protein [Chloroflexota bacterium]
MATQRETTGSGVQQHAPPPTLTLPLKGGGDLRTPVDFVHTGPGTPAGRWLRTFWQPVYRAEDLRDGRAVPIRIMGEDFTLYRGEENPHPSPLPEGEGTASLSTQHSALSTAPAHLLAFRCAHRGTQLSTGWVEGNNLRCFYHGWKYDGSGQCIEQPAEPEPFCQRIKIRAYPVQEYLGLIFAYLGEGEPPPLPRFTELENGARGVVDPTTSGTPCNFFNLLDTDPVHIYFVHRRASARGSGTDIPVLQCEETAYGFVTYATGSSGTWAYHTHMPNVVHGRRDGGGEAITWRVPVDDDNCVSFGVNLLMLEGDAADAWWERRRTRRGVETQRRVNELGAAILRGEVRVHDVEDRSVLFNVQDYTAQVGLGRIVDVEHQRLGRVDLPAIMLRSIWSREIRALADGRPLKQWDRPSEFLALGDIDVAPAGTAAR